MTQNLMQTFARRVKQRDLGQDVKVIYRVAGGMPSQRVDYEIAVDSISGAQVAAYDARRNREKERAVIAADTLDVAQLFDDLSAGLQSLSPKVKLLPDALVGSLTIRVGDDQDTLYFVPEEEKRRKPDQRLAPTMERALGQFWSMAKRVTERLKDPKHE